MSYNEIYEKALLTSKKSFGINGEEVLIISKTEIGKLIWDLAKELKISGIITISSSLKDSILLTKYVEYIHLISLKKII